MWGLARTNMFPSTQKDRANVLESQPRRPRALPSQTPLPPSFQPRSISPPPPLQSLSVCRHLPRIRTSFSHLPALLASLPRRSRAAASCHRSHFSSPEAHSWVRGNVWLYLCDADILLDSYCLGAELAHSKFIKGQFNSKFMKWASVKVLFVCSQGASCMLWLTPLPFPALIGIYWVVSFSSMLGLV